MAQFSISSRFIRSVGPAIVLAAVVPAALLLRTSESSAVQGSQLVRGNKPGEWRYWGGDAWSSRYSALDQINASNFNSLQVAWQWNAGAFGSDEYYRTTPIYANGRLFTVATTRRVATAIDPENGKLAAKASESTMGTVHRNFIIYPTGNYLLVANQQSNNIVIFKRDKQTGQLQATGKEITVPTPVCLVMLKK
jgi:glucose dehydrogenase